MAWNRTRGRNILTGYILSIHTYTGKHYTEKSENEERVPYWPTHILNLRIKTKPGTAGADVQ